MCSRWPSKARERRPPLSALAGKLPRVGAAATAGAALLGPAVVAYTTALGSGTAVPAWHDGYREMPYVFVGSAATAAGGLGLLTAPGDECGPARNLALLGTGLELAMFERMRHRLGMVAEPYHDGKGGTYIKAGKIQAIAGAAGSLLRGKPVAHRLSGAALIAASAATRWGIFHAGKDSANDPRYTVVPQRERMR